MQNSKNNTRQVYLFGCLFLLFYTATAVQRDIAQRYRAGAGRYQAGAYKPSKDK